MDEKTVKDSLNSMFTKSESGDYNYDKIDQFIASINQREGGQTLLRTLANPTSGLNPFIRTLIKVHLGHSWYGARTEHQINAGKRMKTRRYRKFKF